MLSTGSTTEENHAAALRLSGVVLLSLVRSPALFLDDEEPFGVLDDVLDVRIDVPGQDDEMGRYGTDRLVLGSCRHDLLYTLRVVALAEKRSRNVVRGEGRADVLDPLVDLAEEGLVPLSSITWHGATKPVGFRVQ
jgi:hypothetical protein